MIRFQASIKILKQIFQKYLRVWKMSTGGGDEVLWGGQSDSNDGEEDNL